MEIFIGALMASVLVRALVNCLKPLWEKSSHGAKISLFVSLGLGVLICTAAGIDIFAQSGMGLALPYAGCVLSGIAAGGGANVIHDIAEGIGAAKNGKEANP
jgi:hypothetical protein